jgi:hypothetical protein
LQEIEYLIKSVDKNNNGKLEFDEFVEVFAFFNPFLFVQLLKKVENKEYANQVGGIAKLVSLRMADVGKYPEPNGKVFFLNIPLINSISGRK